MTGTIEWISESVTRVLGWPVADMLARPLLEFVHPDDVATVKEAQSRLTQAGHATVEMRLRARESGYRWVSSSARVRADEQGTAIGWIASWRDVGAEYNAQWVAESRTRLRVATLQSMLDPHVLLQAVRDDSGKVVDFAYVEANEAACAYNRVERQELIGSTVMGLLPAHQATGLLDQYIRVVNTGVPLVLDDFVYPHEIMAEPRHFDIRGVKVGDAISLTWRDVTDRAEQAARIAASEARYRLLAEASVDVVVTLDSDGALTYVSPAVRDLLGWDPGELIGTTMLTKVHPDDLALVADAQQRMHSSETGQGQVIARVRCADGSYRCVGGVARELRAEDGTPTGVVATWRDVTAEVEAQRALAKSERHYRLLAENASDLVALDAMDAVVGWVSPSIERLGYLPRDVLGQPFTSFVHPDDWVILRRAGEQTARGESVTVELRIRRNDGKYRWFRGRTNPITDDTGAVTARVSGWQDIDDERNTRQALASSEERFRTAMQSAPAGMALMSLQRSFTEVNPALCRILGAEPDWLLGRGVVDVLTEADAELDRRMRDHLLAGAEGFAGPETLAGAESLTARDNFVSWEHQMLRSDGRHIWVEQSIGVLHDSSGEVTSFVCQFVDVTQARQAREQLRFLATHDPLTNLVNRRELITEIDERLTHEPRAGVNVAVLFIDVDGLKSINDTYGHLVGDGVIATVAQRLRRSVRHADVVARMGGDEFVIVLTAITTLEDAGRVAAKIHAQFNAPIHTGDHTIPITLSIGLTLIAPGDNADTALTRADTALYQAKNEGRNRTVVDRQPASAAGESDPR